MVNVNCDISELVSPVSGQVFIVGTNAIYLCDTGYRLVGSRMRACESDRTWASSAPTCQSMLPFIIAKLVIIPSLALLQNSVVDCGSLMDPSNGHVSTSSGTTFGSIATYTCDTGYTLSGINERTCGADGNWTSFEPVCSSECYI